MAAVEPLIHFLARFPHQYQLADLGSQTWTLKILVLQVEKLRLEGEGAYAKVAHPAA